MAIPLTVQMAMLTLAVVTLAVGPLDYAGCALAMAAVTVPPAMTVSVSQHTGEDHSSTEEDRDQRDHLGKQTKLVDFKV